MGVARMLAELLLCASVVGGITPAASHLLGDAMTCRGGVESRACGWIVSRSERLGQSDRKLSGAVKGLGFVGGVGVGQVRSRGDDAAVCVKRLKLLAGKGGLKGVVSAFDGLNQLNQWAPAAWCWCETRLQSLPRINARGKDSRTSMDATTNVNLKPTETRTFDETPDFHHNHHKVHAPWQNVLNIMLLAEFLKEFGSAKMKQIPEITVPDIRAAEALRGELYLAVQSMQAGSISWLKSTAVEFGHNTVCLISGVGSFAAEKMVPLEKLKPILEDELKKLVGRIDKELLGLKRDTSKEVKRFPSVMVMGARDNDDEQPELLKYGCAIPEILYGKVQGEDVFSAEMKVALSTDDSGNIFLSRPGQHRGGHVLPMASDIMWLRQMAAYSERKTAPSPSEPPAPVTVAAVTLPVNARGDLLVTQRTKMGNMYNGLWVFPGGHVDAGEALSSAAVREVKEETGIQVDTDTLKPVAIWEGTVTSRRRQFCVVFFAALATCGNSEECTMELQTKEVHRAVWVPRELVPRILDTHVRHTTKMDGMLIQDGEHVYTEIELSELQNGLGDGHKFALQAFLKSHAKCYENETPASSVQKEYTPYM